MKRLHLFLEMMATKRGATRSTLSAYGADLQTFYDFLKDQKVESVTFQNIQAYLLTQRQFSPGTIARRLSTLRQFYLFLMQEGEIKENPFSITKITQSKSKTSSYLRQEDIEHLLEGTKAWGEMEGKRLAALLHLFWGTDFSVADIVSLPFPVNMKTSATIGKYGNSEATPFCTTSGWLCPAPNNGVEIGVLALEALEEYLKVRHYFLIQEKESPWLFPSSSQKGHLTRQRFGQLLKELALKVGLDSTDVSLYGLRGRVNSLKEL